MKNTRKRQQTRQSLRNALMDLCEKENYYDITIWDICNQAGTYRSTFYRYYDSKDEVLREIEKEYITGTQNLVDTILDFSSDASEEQLRKYREELTEDMKFHMEHERICRFLLSPAGDIAFRQQMQNSLDSTARASLKKKDSFRRPQITGSISLLLALSQLFHSGSSEKTVHRNRSQNCSLI